MKKKFIIIGILLILFLAIPPIYYFYSEYQKLYVEHKATQALLGKSTANVSQEELNREIINKVSKLIELPEETPTIASITDKTKLQDQPFFARSQNGDKVLIFQSSKKAIIYRESENKIIEVGSINVEANPSTSPTLVPSPTKAVKATRAITTPTVSPTP